MYRRNLLALSLIFALGVFATNNAAMSADPVFCNKYANEADKSAKLAAKFKCGFQGPRWIKGTSPHIAWCLLTDANLVQSEADARASELKECTCQWYANKTMVQIAANIADKCGFTGLRWLESKQAHYDWCFNANPGLDAMKSEIDIRKKMLDGC